MKKSIDRSSATRIINPNPSASISLILSDLGILIGDDGKSRNF